MGTMSGPTFFRLETDQRASGVGLEGTFAGTDGSACWLIGGGPSLAALPCAEIAASPIPKMCLNLGGSGLIRPDFWTSYDPTARFSRSVYLDPGVMKFVHRRRAMDLIPETTWKVCDAPNLYFFERNGARGFADLLDPVDARIVDWADSMVQGIDILHRLGFRTVYLAGCEMRIRPAPRQVELAARAGVECGFSARPDRCDMRMTLGEFVAACARQGLGEKELEACGEMEAYHFDERKPLRALIQTDAHYFRIVQALRLSRRCLALHGLRLISATPGSRLNDHFPYEPAESILDRIRRSIGDPRSEATRGRYALSEAWLPEAVGPMRDIRPHNWGACGPPTARRGADGERGEAVALEAHGPVREVG